MWAVSLLLLLAVASLQASHVDFSGHQVLRCLPTNEQQLRALYKLRQHVVDVDFWLAPAAVRRPVLLRTSPRQPALQHWLHHSNVSCDLFMPDVQTEVERETRQVLARRAEHLGSGAADFDYENYHKLEEINEWVDSIVESYPSIASHVEIGTSYEGRLMKALKLSAGGQNKKAVFIEGGIHAREWVSPATVVYMTKMLLDSEQSGLLEELDWYVLPVFNVDGYEYTWTTNRMWRKTRSKNEPNICMGTDPNRNWPFHWGEDGASGNECAEDYRGSKALSEVEVKAVTEFLKSNIDFRGFIDFHSFSQMWMSPWGWTTQLPDDFDDLNALSKAAVEALEKVHGTKYVYGSIANVIYKASGSSADWTYAEAKIKYSYAVELRDTGRYGFILPPDQIKPSAEETYEALKAFAQHIINN